MEFKLSRIRRGEAIAAGCALILLALLFLVTWFEFGAAGSRSDANGWHSLPTLRWLIVVTAVAALLLAFLQVSRRAPALPVSMSVIVTVLGALTTLGLIIRLPTTDGTPQVGAFLGLAAAAGLTVGAFMSLRQEDGWLPGPDHPIERISVGPPEHS